jgi:hypothetical protein
MYGICTGPLRRRLSCFGVRRIVNVRDELSLLLQGLFQVLLLSLWVQHFHLIAGGRRG